MSNFQQILNVSSMTAPQPLPAVPTIHSGEPSWGDIAGDALQSGGAIMQQVGGIKQEQEKAAAEAAETAEGNRYAREMQKLVAAREQTGNRTQFEQSVRALNDVYLSRGVLKADKLASIRNSYDEGYLDLNEKSRERWAKFDDEEQKKVIVEMQSKYSHLKGKKTSDILRDYNRITNNLDFAIELQNKMNSLDPAKYPEEHARLKEQRDSFFENNIIGQTLESIAEDLHNNTEMFKDPVKVEEYKQSLVAYLTRQKVALSDASIIAESALAKAGAYTVYDNEKAILGISKQNMQEVLDYKKTRADYAIAESFPQLVTLSQLTKTMPPEVYTAFANTPEGRKINNTIAANFAAAATGIDTFDISFEDKSKAMSIAQGLQRTDAPVLLKGSSVVAAAQSINNIPSIANLPDRDFDAVISNARGVAAVFSNPHTQATKRQLSTSNKPNDNAVAAQMDAEERRAKALSSAGAYLQSATVGAQNLRYIIQRSTVFNNLRVNNKGQLVYVPGSSPLAAVAEGALEQVENYGGMIDAINTDVAKTTGLSGQGLIDFYKAIDIPMLGEGERAQSAPAFNWVSKTTEEDEIRTRVERLKEQKKNMSPAALKEYGAGLDKDIKAGEDFLSKLEAGDEYIISSNISRSDTMTNAFYDMSPEDQEAMVAAREAEFMEAVDKPDADMDNTQKITSGYYEKLAKDAEAAEKELEEVEAEIIKAEERYELTGRQHYLDMLKGLEEERRELNAIINKKYREFEE